MRKEYMAPELIVEKFNIPNSNLITTSGLNRGDNEEISPFSLEY